jgi:hypothetical protein
MHDRDLYADVLQENDLPGEGSLQFWVRHGVAAVFDDDPLAPEIPDIGQGLHENARSLYRLFH